MHVSLRTARSRAGFTLVELMIVVAVLGVLVATALPSFAAFVRRSKTSEAVEKLAYLFRMSSTYATGERSLRAVRTAPLPTMFPQSVARTPAAIPRAVRVVDPAGAWNQPTWEALSFAISDPHYYSYEYVSSGGSSTAMFSARGVGDLDGDGRASTFERSGRLTPTGEMQGSPGIWMNSELE